MALLYKQSKLDKLLKYSRFRLLSIRVLHLKEASGWWGEWPGGDDVLHKELQAGSPCAVEIKLMEGHPRALDPTSQVGLPWDFAAPAVRFSALLCALVPRNPGLRVLHCISRASLHSGSDSDFFLVSLRLFLLKSPLQKPVAAGK